MLRMAGFRFHPGMRVLLGMALIAAGLLRHNATPLIVIGAVVGALGLVSLVGGAARDDSTGTPRR
jgi:hypothetical protein